MTLPRYKVITLCGSSKFKNDFIRAQRELTLRGYIVISLGLFGHDDNEFQTTITPEVKIMLDQMHRQKIDMSDGIFVINKGNYIGNSTSSEIAYAVQKGKFVVFLENHDQDEMFFEDEQKPDMTVPTIAPIFLTEGWDPKEAEAKTQEWKLRNKT